MHDDRPSAFALFGGGARERELGARHQFCSLARLLARLLVLRASLPSSTLTLRTWTIWQPKARRSLKGVAAQPFRSARPPATRDGNKSLESTKVQQCSSYNRLHG